MRAVILSAAQNLRTYFCRKKQATASNRKIHEVGHRERLRKAREALQRQVYRPLLHDPVRFLSHLLTLETFSSMT